MLELGSGISSTSLDPLELARTLNKDRHSDHGLYHRLNHLKNWELLHPGAVL